VNYETIKAMNFSSLKHLAVSPKLYKYRTENPEPYKPAFALGSAAHCLILEPGKFDSRYAVFDGTRRGKEWDAWEAAHPGVESLKPAERATAIEIAKAVREHRRIAPLLSGGLYEETIEWTDKDTGLRCKGRVDYLRPTQLVDIKTAKDIAPRWFSRDAAQYLYHGQLAWYWEGAIQAGRLPPDADLPYIVVVEKKPPYDCGVYRMTPADMTKGVALYRSLLRKFLDCEAANYWPGILPDTVDLDIPDWAPGSQTDDDEEES